MYEVSANIKMVSFFVHILLIFCSFFSQEPNVEAYHGREMLKWHTLQLHLITIKNRNLIYFFFFNDKQKTSAEYLLDQIM